MRRRGGGEGKRDRDRQAYRVDRVTWGQRKRKREEGRKGRRGGREVWRREVGRKRGTGRREGWMEREKHR